MTDHEPRPERTTTNEREGDIIDALVHLADTLVADYDVIDFLHYLIARCTELIDIDEAGVMLADPAGQLHPVAASTEQVRFLELFEVQNHDGPCLDAFRTGRIIVAADLTDHRQQWPTFADEALNSGFRSAHSVPMQLRSETIGAINLLSSNVGNLTETDLKLAGALADIATIGLLQERRAATAISTSGALAARARRVAFASNKPRASSPNATKPVSMPRSTPSASTPATTNSASPLSPNASSPITSTSITNEFRFGVLGRPPPERQTIPVMRMYEEHAQVSRTPVAPDTSRARLAQTPELAGIDTRGGGSTRVRLTHRAEARQIVIFRCILLSS